MEGCTRSKGFTRSTYKQGMWKYGLLQSQPKCCSKLLTLGNLPNNLLNYVYTVYTHTHIYYIYMCVYMQYKVEK